MVGRQDLEITAQTEDDGTHGPAASDAPIDGVQFHPESILTREGHHLLRNFPEGGEGGGLG